MKQIDRIRNMNAEELAKWTWQRLIDSDCQYCPAQSRCDILLRDLYHRNVTFNCKNVIKAWLESEVEE